MLLLVFIFRTVPILALSLLLNNKFFVNNLYYYKGPGQQP